MLSGEKGSDGLHGGDGVDKLWGGAGNDSFFFDGGDTGDVFFGQADTIHDFSDEDTIYLQGSYSYAGATSAPADSQYGIWWKLDINSWMVTYNAPGETGYNDIIVKSGDPHGDVAFY